jgi:uncharacterized coiled-coil DUF342 family protein
LAVRRDEIFSRKAAIGRDIVALIRSVRGLKAERNALTDEVRNLKAERDTLNTAIREKITAVKALNDEKRAVEQKLNLRESPSRIKANIERLEHQIETEVLPFDKEQKLMKVIRDLRKQYGEAQKASGIWGKSHDLSREIDDLRAKADEAHHAIQQKSKASQEKHELMLEACRKIDELRKKEEEVGKELEPVKEEVQPKDQQLQELMRQLKELTGQVNAEERAEAVAHQQEQKKKLSDRQAEVQDKFRKGEKLTTEDLLVLQTLDMPAESAESKSA